MKSPFSRISLILVTLLILAGIVVGSRFAWLKIRKLDQNSFRVPRTESGVPDFQGLYTNESLTQLERKRGVPLVLSPKQAIGRKEEILSNLGKQAPAVPGIDGKLVELPFSVPYDFNWKEVSQFHFGKVNGEYRSSWIVDPPDGQIPYNKEAREALEKDFLKFVQGSYDGPEELSSCLRCLIGWGSTGGPPMLNVNYNNNYQIVQTADAIVILIEMNHDARIIRLGGTRLPENMRPVLGDSIGRWEGDTLVVETTNLSPLQMFTHSGFKDSIYIPSTAKITEWFSHASENEILYRFQVEDPTAYTQPWRGEMTWKVSAGPMFEYACHEGNRSVGLALAGSRRLEKKR